ncbi:MAG: ATP-binding protein [Prochloraceae cyanobacterium]
MQPLTVLGTLDSLGAIANYVITAAKEAGLDKKSTYKLRLAVDEIATNIIIHGYQEAGCQGVIDLQAKLDPQTLSIFLEDTGAIFDPTQQAPPTDLKLSLEKRPIGGLGIYLAIQGVDRFIYERVGDRNRTTFIVTLVNKL